MEEDDEEDNGPSYETLYVHRYYNEYPRMNICALGAYEVDANDKNGGKYIVNFLTETITFVHGTDLLG